MIFPITEKLKFCSLNIALIIDTEKGIKIKPKNLSMVN